MKRPLFALLLLVFTATASGQLVADVIDTAVNVSSPETISIGKIHQVGVQSTGALGPFTGVALQGITESDTLGGWIRFEHQGTLSAWSPLYIVRSYTDGAFLAAFRSNTVRTADRFHLRFDVEQSETVEIVLAGTFLDAPQEQFPEEPAPLPLGNYVIIAPELHDRAEWGAASFRGIPIPLNRPDYEEMTLHHTAGFSAVTLAEGLEQVRRIQDFHQNGRGWSDIGYQFLMDQEGRLYQGRPFYNPSVPFEDGPPLSQGAHVGGNNRGNIGLSLMGCYHPPEGPNCRDVMTGAARDSLVATYAFLSERYDVDPDLLAGHRDFNATSCPGDNNYGLLPAFRTEIAELLVTGNASLGTAAISAEVDSIGVVFLRWRFLTDAGIESFSILRDDESGTTSVFEREGASDGEWVDATIQNPGPAIYLLVARGRRGRVQTLSTTEVFVRPQQSFILAQSFPNPASNQVTIRYHLQQPGVVSLQIFDLTGRRVVNVTETYRKEGVWHAATVATDDLSGGMYYYHIQVEGFTDTIFRAAYPLVIAR